MNREGSERISFTLVHKPINVAILQCGTYLNTMSNVNIKLDNVCEKKRDVEMRESSYRWGEVDEDMVLLVIYCYILIYLHSKRH